MDRCDYCKAAPCSCDDSQSDAEKLIAVRERLAQRVTEIIDLQKEIDLEWNRCCDAQVAWRAAHPDINEFPSPADLVEWLMRERDGLAAELDTLRARYAESESALVQAGLSKRADDMADIVDPAAILAAIRRDERKRCIAWLAQFHSHAHDTYDMLLISGWVRDEMPDDWRSEVKP